MMYSQLAYYKLFYDLGYYNEPIIYNATKNGILTRDEYAIIIGKPFVDRGDVNPFAYNA